ncbi:MAG: hypothetical protein Q9225_005357 [Loekoesia sp. 1 TL-2023]
MLADLDLVAFTNTRLGRHDDKPWWGQFVEHNRRVKAEEEARIVTERFGSIILADDATKERIANLINNELLDVDHLHSRTAPPNEHGVRPSVKALRAKRKEDIEGAFLNVMAQRFYERIDAQQNLEETQSGTGAVAQPDTNSLSSGIPQDIAATQTSSTAQGIELLQPGPREAIETSSTERASKDGLPHELISTELQNSKMVTETLGKDTVQEDTEMVDVIDGTQLGEVQEPSSEDDVAAVTAAIGETFISEQSSISACMATPESISGVEAHDSSARDSQTSKEQSTTLATDSGASRHGVHKEFSAMPAFILQESQQEHQQLLPCSQPLTPLDTGTPRGKLLPASRPILSFAGIAMTQSSDTPFQNSTTATHREPTVSRHPRQAVTPTAQATDTLSQGSTVSGLGEPTATRDSSSVSATPYYTAYPVRWNRLKWAYRTHTTTDFKLQRQGVWLYDKPQTFLSHQSSNQITSMTAQPQIVVVPSTSEWGTATTPSFVSNANSLVLYTHHIPWPLDSRWAEETGGLLPDFVFYTRLTEYQALESLGYSFLITTIVDDATAPPRFSNLFPAIRERNGLRTFPIHRQRVCAQSSGGRYSLFDPQSGEPTALYFDYRFDNNTGIELPYPGFVTEMEARMERCLNIALYDHTQTMVIEYLARLIQLCLQIKGAWIPALARVITTQFAQEFNFNVRSSWRNMAAQSLCECEWAGDDVLAHQHTAACRSRSRMQGEVFRGRRRCLKDLVEAMEAKHWILRAWRTQHPTEPDGKRRIQGHGFPGCVLPPGWVPKMGKGWDGFWASDDDICV